MTWFWCLRFSSDAQEELDSVEAELEMVEVQVAELLQKQTELTSRKNALLRQLEEATSSSSSARSAKSPGASPSMSKQEMQRYDGTGACHVPLYC